MRFVVRVFLSTFAVILTSYILPGVHVDNFLTALVVAIVIAFLNSVLRPILIVLTIPVTILTLGLFLLVINAMLVELAAYLVDGFSVDGFLWALIFSLLLSILNSIFQGLGGEKQKNEY